MADSTPLTPKPCFKCGSPGELMKAGSNRFWVQCAKYGRNGNCNAIGAQTETKKQAIERWNAVN